MANNPLFSKDVLNMPEPSAYVQKARKALPYSITSIGGANDLQAWKLTQERLEAKWQKDQAKGRAERRENAVNVLTGSKQQMPLTEVDQVEGRYSAVRHGMAHPSVLLAVVDKSPVAPKQVESKEPGVLYKPLQAFTNFCVKLWHNAFSGE